MSQPSAAGLIVIGNEILSGRTRDANLPWLAERLGGIGIRLAEARIIPDVESEIVSAVNALRACYRYVFTSGGLGPTHDDITAACVAAAFGVPIERNAEAVRRLQAYYEPGQLNAARLTMADIPKGATLVDNPVSQAPGFRLDNVYVLAGIPRIFQAMVGGIVPALVGGPPLVAGTVVVPLPEGAVAEGIAAVQRQFPDVEIGSYPGLRGGVPGVSLVVSGTDTQAVTAATQAIVGLVRSLGAEPLTLGQGAAEKPVAPAG